MYQKLSNMHLCMKNGLICFYNWKIAKYAKYVTTNFKYKFVLL